MCDCKNVSNHKCNVSTNVGVLLLKKIEKKTMEPWYSGWSNKIVLNRVESPVYWSRITFKWYNIWMAKDGRILRVCWQTGFFLYSPQKYCASLVTKSYKSSLRRDLKTVNQIPAYSLTYKSWFCNICVPNQAY